ncbi:MAG: YigZ family protein [Oscillospiraceae bacterium]|nr:YigZ family protein [Oscillospiraceae bacterium]
MRDYKTAAARAQAEFIEKKSRFITYLAPVVSEAEATAFIAEIGSMHREAAHVVYAYSLLDGQIKRFSDAGEPQGTAGMPTLDVLLKKEIYNVCLATVRYFGGVLLGTGGLTRAYSKGASDAVAAAKIITRTWGDMLRLSLPYNLYGRVSPYLSTTNTALVDSDFGESVVLTVFSPKAQTDKLCADLVEMTAATIKIEKINELFFDI